MSRVVFKDVVKRINVNVDRHNTERLYYVGGEHIDSCELLVTKHGLIEGSTIGFKFHFGFEPGHILFMSRNPHLRKASMATFSGVCSDSTYVVETRDENVLLQKYLLLEMQSDRFWEWAEANKSGGVNYLINYKTLDTYEFSLPSLSEQKVLAEKLWAAYEVKQSYLRMIEATQQMVKSQFIEMFKDAPKLKLSDFCDLKARIGWQGLKHDEFLDKGEYYLVTGVDFEGNTINWSKCHFVTKDRYDQDVNIQLNNGDVLVTKDGTIGKVAIVAGLHSPATLNSGVFVLRDRKGLTLNKFLFYSLLTKDFENFIEDCKTGSTIAHLNQKAFVNYQLPTPDMCLQEKFVSIAEQADKSISELRKSIDAIDKVIKSLINENL